MAKHWMRTVAARRRTAALILGGICVLTAQASWSMGLRVQPPGRICILDQVLDGDSLRLTCNGESVEVRLHCIDAPEHGQGRWGQQSLRHLRAIMPGQVEVWAVDVDRFGRTVADVYTIGPDRRLLNLAQVESGNAAVYERYCSDPAYARAERAARQAGLGIWARPGEQQTPWVFRHRAGH